MRIHLAASGTAFRTCSLLIPSATSISIPPPQLSPSPPTIAENGRLSAPRSRVRKLGAPRVPLPWLPHASAPRQQRTPFVLSAALAYLLTQRHIAAALCHWGLNMDPKLMKTLNTTDCALGHRGLQAQLWARGFHSKHLETAMYKHGPWRTPVRQAYRLAWHTPVR